MEHQIMFRRFVVLIAAGASLAAAADVRVVEEIAVKVNGDIITRGELDEQRRLLETMLRQEQKLAGAQLAAAVEERSKDILSDKIDELLLVQRAKDLNISVDADVNRRVAQMQVESKITDPDKFHDYVRQATGLPWEEFHQKLVNSYLTNRVISQEVGSRIAFSEPELRKYYEDHKADFVRQEEVYLSQIFISTEGKTPEQVANAEKKGKDLAARARKGERFSDLANANSDDPETAKTGGHLPARQRGMSLKEIDDFAFKEKKGAVTEPIKIANPPGFVVVRIDERFEAGQAPFEDVKEQIQDKLSEPKMGPKVRDLLTRLRQQAFLEVKDGYVDTNAAPGKDTHWHDVAQLKPQTITKEEVLAHRRPKKVLGILPAPRIFGSSKKAPEVDTSTLGTHKEDTASAATTTADATTPAADSSTSSSKRTSKKSSDSPKELTPNAPAPTATVPIKQ
jgi:peptidyl-prolyl cis-trans isomerase SurA